MLNLVIPLQGLLTSSQSIATLCTRHQSLLNSSKLLQLTMLVKYKGKYYLSYTNNITDNVQKRKNALGRTNIRGIPRKVLSL